MVYHAKFYYVLNHYNFQNGDGYIDTEEKYRKIANAITALLEK